MTVDFRIGNATVEAWENTYELTVKRIALDEAPQFLNDTLTGNQNFRSMSNYTYSRFITQHGLQDFDTNTDNDDSSMITVLDQHMLDCIVTARKAHEAIIGEKVPGWALEDDFVKVEGGGIRFYNDAEIDAATDSANTDADLARLLWFEWWMTWALENCERPAIYRY